MEYQVIYGFPNNFRIKGGSGTVANVKVPFWYNGIEIITYKGEEYQFSELHLGKAQLTYKSSIIFSTDGGYFKSYRFEYNKVTYTLSRSWVSWKIMLDGKMVGFINRTRGFWKPIYVSSIPDEISELAAVFLFCVTQKSDRDSSKLIKCLIKSKLKIGNPF